MGKRLDDLIASDLAIRKGAWYYLKQGNVNLGNSQEDAEAKLDSLGYVKPNGNDRKETTEPKNLEAIKENSEELGFYESLAGDLQDIKSFRREGVYDVYVFGVDSRLEKNPVVSKCPFVFSWRRIENSVNSGPTVINEGWTVLSRSKIKADPRTGRKWITTNRDDSPKEDFIRVGSCVLCYADKAKWMQLQAEEVAKNITRTGEMADKRSEHAKQMATLSKQDVVSSMNGYKSVNVSEKAQAVEFVSQGSKAKSDEVNAIFNELDLVKSEEAESFTERKLADLRQKVESGQTSNSILGSTRISIDNL